jgi:nucleoside-diphosphate-sugar epimerase
MSAAFAKRDVHAGFQAADYLKLTGHVNTYTFTKMLTEMAIAEFHNSSFPVAIVRPSIVVSPPAGH